MMVGKDNAGCFEGSDSEASQDSTELLAQLPEAEHRMLENVGTSNKLLFFFFFWKILIPQSQKLLSRKPIKDENQCSFPCCQLLHSSVTEMDREETLKRRNPLRALGSSLSTVSPPDYVILHKGRFLSESQLPSLEKRNENPHLHGL